MARCLALLLALGVLSCGGKAVIDAAASAGGGGAGGTTTSSSSSSGGGTSTTCGGLIGSGCAADEFCDFADDQCGGNDGMGLCTKRPQGCAKNLEPTCGCDGLVHDNACAANQAGFDQNDLGSCTPPVGQFGCGAHFCTLESYYCRLDAADIGGSPSSYACTPAPSACGGQAGCDCLGNVAVQCGGSCISTADGGILIACPGG